MARYTTRQAVAGDGKTQLYQLLDAAAGVLVSIAPSCGGEMSSFQLRRSADAPWQEMLYRGGDFSEELPPHGWQGRAPHLWPAVGRSYLDEQVAAFEASGEKKERPAACKYKDLDGTTREIGVHGFAMQCEWGVIPGSATADDEAGASVGVVLDSSKVPEAIGASQYPHDYQFAARYTLKDGVLRVNYEVFNRGGAFMETMPFSIGNHASFVYPFVATDGSKWSGGRLVTNAAASYEHKLTPLSLLSGEVALVHPDIAGEGLPLSDPKALDTVLGADSNSRAAAAAGAAGADAAATSEEKKEGTEGGAGAGGEDEDEDESNASYFTVDQPGVLKLTLQQYVRPKMFSNPADASAFADLIDARHFVLWGEGTDETGGFICVEPWLGGPNSLNTGRGRVALSPGHSFQWAFTLKPEWQGSGI